MSRGHSHALGSSVIKHQHQMVIPQELANVLQCSNYNFLKCILIGFFMIDQHKCTICKVAEKWYEQKYLKNILSFKH